MSAVNTLTCPSCSTAFVAPPARRGGKPRIYCGRVCQIKSANERRVRGKSNLSTASEPSGQPIAPGVITIPPTAQTPLSDAPNRLEFLMEKAHSRVGVNAFEIAEIARARGISAWAPLAKILAR
jgi:hypothetical protein